MTRTAFDVLVIGGGLAGLAAATQSAERGLSVAVLEQGVDERYACNSRYAMGFITIGGCDIRADPEILHETISGVTGGHADPMLMAHLAENGATALRWLVGRGVRFINAGARSAPKPLLIPLVPQQPGLHWPGRGADVMLRTLAAKLSDWGGHLFRGTRAEELMMVGGRCVGVAARRDRDSLRFEARAVVIADGGFQGHRDLLRRYVTSRPECLLQRNASTGNGSGLLMAEAVGAELTGMECFYGHVHSRDALSNPRLWPYPTIDVAILSGMIVDRRGARFVDEGRGGIYVANAIARLNDPLEAVAIFDQAIWDGPARSLPIPANPHLVKEGGTMHRGDTIEQLAERVAIPASALAATIAQYNHAVQSGGLELLRPPRSADIHSPKPIRKPPLYAVPVCAGITYTMGGIAIDEYCRVRHRAGGTIDGLFAAGSTTGGHEGGPLAGYTGGLAKALVFGLRAADSIATSFV